MNIRGGVNPLTFCQKCMGTRGVTPQNEACMSARCWKCIIGRGIEPEHVCFVGGAPLTRANGCINFSKCMQAWGVLHLSPVDLFFLGDVLKPMGKPGNTWGHPKNILEYSGLKTIEDHSGPMATSGPSSHKMAEIYSILNILKCMRCRGYQ